MATFEGEAVLLSQIGDLVLDVTISATHSRSAQITNHPIDKSSPVADHKRNQPEELQMEGLITDTPLIGTPDPDRSRTAFDLLEQFWEGQETITIVTDLAVYTDMAMASLVVPRSADVGNALRFQATFVKMRKVSSQTAAIPADPIAGPGTENKGKQTGTPPKADTDTRGQSVLAGLFGGA